MHKSLTSFVFVFCLTSLSTAFGVGLESVKIERSPSVSVDMHDFFDRVEQSVSLAEKQNPSKCFCLDYSTVLINLFDRLETATPQARATWLDAFKQHSSRLAYHHRIRGVRLFYRSLVDLKVAAVIIEPFVRSKKLRSLSLTPLLSLEAAHSQQAR